MDFYDIKLGDCLSMIENGATIKQQKGSKGLPITRIETLSNNRFNRDRLGYADIFDANKYSHYILDDKDILMSHINILMSHINSKAFLGRSVLYKRQGNEQIIHGMNVLRIKTKKDILDQEYAYYYFQTSFFKKNIHNIRKDAVNQSSINISDIKDIIIQIPSLKNQKNIATVLSNIDCKIALNTQINDNLEATARQLYDYWFVQFDFPVENGKPYKSSGGKMVWNKELKKEIPINWNVERLGKRCKVLLGGTPDTKDEKLWGEGYSWLNSGEVAVFPILKSERQITQAGLDSSATVLATKGSVTLSITRYLRPSILAIDACINQSVVAIEENEFYKKEFLYPYIKAEVPILMSLRTGAQQPHINKETVENIKLLHPSNEIMDKYLRYTTPVYKEIVNLAQETENLTKQRDELLPLLMNGQVTVNYHLSLAHITPTTLAPLCTP